MLLNLIMGDYWMLLDVDGGCWRLLEVVEDVGGSSMLDGV